MRLRWFNHLLRLALVLGLLAGSALMQRSLNGDRQRLKLTRVTPLENAPPLLAFVTVALGGFRGLISNALWVRMNDLQLDEKYFEMVQLADWITKLQPTLATVWIHQAWNLAYNISVKFPDPAVRWKWVKQGTALLRDEALRYNPNESQIYRELAWFFQHKMGASLDDAHMFYKRWWRAEMEEVFGGPKPDFDELIDPKSDDARKRAARLRDEYKLDPKVMREVDTQYGPLEWRLPESHAIYWAHLGLRKSAKHELITLRRVIYQSLLLGALRGRIIEYPGEERFDFGPNLPLIPRANNAYQRMMREEGEMEYNIESGHKNFLKQAISDLYVHNRISEAQKWYDYAREQYPKYYEGYLDGLYYPAPPRTNYTLTEFAMARFDEILTQTGKDRMQSVIEGALGSHFIYLAIGDEDLAAGYLTRAREFYRRFEIRFGNANKERVSLPPWPKLYADLRDRLIKRPPPEGLNQELTLRLCTRLQLPLPRDIEKRVDVAQLARNQAPAAARKMDAERNQREGAAFLARNRDRPGVRVLASGLQYRVLREGTGRSPTAEERVRVHYTGRLINGSVFDTSRERASPQDELTPREFDLTGVVPGWQEALKLMKEGSHWEIVLPAYLGYGEAGTRDIGPDAVLVFDIELLKVLPKSGPAPEA